jgi:hypothetical protein
MLTSGENGTLSTSVLLAAARARLGSYCDSLTEAYIPQLVSSSTDAERELALERILQPKAEAGERIAQQRGFVTLVNDLSDNFMLYLPMSGATAGDRLIVKLSYDSPRSAPRLHGVRERLGWIPVIDGFNVPLAGFCASYHFELEAPVDMEVVFGVFLGTREGKLVPDWVESAVRRAHFNLSDLDRGFGRVEVGLKARSGSLLGGAALFAAVNMVALLFVRARLPHIVAGGSSQPQTNGGGTEPAVAALLAVPALLIGYILRPGEHEILSAFLVFPRLAALVSALTSLVAAALLFGGYPEAKLSDLYLGLMVIAAACAVILAGSWLGQRR